MNWKWHGYNKCYNAINSTNPTNSMNAIIAINAIVIVKKQA